MLRHIILLCCLKMPLLFQVEVDIVDTYFQCLQNATIGARQYALKYAQRRRRRDAGMSAES